MPRKKKKKTAQFRVDLSRIDECNLTELIQTAQRMGHAHVGRHMDREDIEDLLFGEELPVTDPLEGARDRLFQYVTGNSIMLSAHSCSLHCPTCPKNRVVDCLTRNHDLVIPKGEHNPFQTE